MSQDQAVTELKPKPVLGRPTKLTPALIETARDYVVNYEQYGDVHSSHVGLACALNIAESTLYEWAQKKDTVFPEIVAAVKAKQHQVLINKGLSGEFNPTIAKLLLTKHGYSERVDNNISGRLDYSDMTEQQIDARLAQLITKATDNQDE